MIRYYCNVCGEKVSSLTDLVDLTSCLSSRTRDEWNDAGFRQEHVCKKCVHALKHFITTLGRKSDPAVAELPEVVASVQ